MFPLSLLVKFAKTEDLTGHWAEPSLAGQPEAGGCLDQVQGPGWRVHGYDSVCGQKFFAGTVGVAGVLRAGASSP